MSHRGRDTKSQEHSPEEVVPLTQDEELPEGSSPSSTNVDLEGQQSNGDLSPFLRTISTEPELSHMNREKPGFDDTTTRLRFLHDDVEKLYKPVFDISSLTNQSEAVVDDSGRRFSVPSFVTEKKQFSEDDFSIHRKVSYPHIHQPLRSLSSRSMKSIPQANIKKKKKKKKKKKISRSFPSKGAIQSPTIPEEEDEEDGEEDGEEDSDEEMEDVDDTDAAEGTDLSAPVSRKTSEVHVGFYIGGSELTTGPDHQDSDIPPEIIISQSSSDFSDPKPMFTFEDETEPQLSERVPMLDVPMTSQSRKFSSDSTSGHVKFQLGGEPSDIKLHKEDSDGEIWKRREKENGHAPTEPNGHVPTESNGHAPTEQTEPSVSLSRTSSGKKRHHHHHQHFKERDLILRRQKGSEVKLDGELKRSPTETDEAALLHKADLDEMASHRWEDVRGIRRHKINRRNKNNFQSIVHIGKAHKEKKKPKKKFDHSPHDVFVELDELFVKDEHEWEWREKARWIKFEEDVEEGAERWGKPHVASLSFHSLIELRKGLEYGTVLLDLEAENLQTIIHNVVENLLIRDLISEEIKGNILRTLLLKHKHQSEKQHGSLLRSFSNASFGSGLGLSGGVHHGKSNSKDEDRQPLKDKANLEMVKVDVDNNTTGTESIHIGLTPQDPGKKNVQDIMKRIPTGSEASTVLVGTVDFLQKPVMAFVRLSEGRFLENLTEVPLPVRFVFILLGPEKSGMDYHEVGRSLSTLMTNQFFHDVAYRAESREELLHAINGFLDDSIVLPPGDWDQKTLLPIMDMARKRAHIRRRKKQKLEEQEELIEKEKKSHIPTDPLQRTKCMFGGLINDIRRRYPYYLSDFKDACNITCLASFIFIFFACLSPCIAFGGILSEKTKGLMGVSETVLSTCLCGVVFGLFSGQPLLIVGATGPVLVFEQSLYKFCESNDIEFLPFRAWIGFWVFLISTLTVAAEGSFLIRYVTRFTEEIFAILISLIFIYEVIKKLDKTFQEHPLMPHYPTTYNGSDVSMPTPYLFNSTAYNITFNATYYSEVQTLDNLTYNTPDHEDHVLYTDKKIHQPNTALMSTILCIGTFLVAWFLKICRNSKFLGRHVRRALGDFGILLAILSMVLLDYLVTDQVYTQKLQIGSPFVPTSPKKRGWFINPLGMKKPVEVWMIFGAIIPAFLIFILLFMEIQLTEVILNKKDRKLKKGSGFHLDQFIMGILTFVCGLYGLPWMCAATVRTIAHVSSLSVMSRTHAPGEKPRLIEVKEQRLTGILVSVMIGVSLTMGSLLRAIPLAVLFGVFLYLGIVSLGSVQMFKRLKLLLMPVKYHPSVGYVRRVRTIKMNLFTIIQAISLITLWIVKSTAAAIAFPFFLILLIPIRNKLMPKFYTEKEFEELDKEEDYDSDFDYEGDPDFYEQAHMPI
ncbi:hypothetical protein SNE40_022447 [Patella caerulea]|uniref:Anion exchange protein n=1 Tax=Patella caerulea TaxID=87958 RepID=A0AAN8GFS8_PATCE